MTNIFFNYIFGTTFQNPFILAVNIRKENNHLPLFVEDISGLLALPSIFWSKIQGQHKYFMAFYLTSYID